jgi:hypothetical protein
MDSTGVQSDFVQRRASYSSHSGVFPDTFRRDEHHVRKMFDRICSYMNVDPSRLELELVMDEEGELRNHLRFMKVRTKVLRVFTVTPRRDVCKSQRLEFKRSNETCCDCRSRTRTCLVAGR